MKSVHANPPEKICRLCLSDSGVILPIFEGEVSERFSVPLPQKILSCLAIKVMFMLLCHCSMMHILSTRKLLTFHFPKCSYAFLWYAHSKLPYLSAPVYNLTPFPRSVLTIHSLLTYAIGVCMRWIDFMNFGKLVNVPILHLTKFAIIQVKVCHLM